MTELLALIKALPEILALLKLIDQRCKEMKIDSDVKKSVTSIHADFANKDADALKTLFNS